MMRSGPGTPRAVVEDATLRTVRDNPGLRAEELYGILNRQNVGASFAAVFEALRILWILGSIERSEGRYWTDCECWGRVRARPPDEAR